MATTTSTGLPIPTSGDVPDVPADLLKLGTALDGVTCPLFTSTNDRDTAWSALDNNPGASPFGLCMVGSDVGSATLYRRKGSGWVQVIDNDTVAYATAGTEALTPASGNTLNVINLVRIGRVAFLYFSIGLGTPLSDGNITNTTIANITAAGWKPSTDSLQYPASSGSTGSGWSGFLNSADGAITVAATNGSYSGTINGSLSYVTAS